MNKFSCFLLDEFDLRKFKKYIAGWGSLGNCYYRKFVWVDQCSDDRFYKLSETEIKVLICRCQYLLMKKRLDNDYYNEECKMRIKKKMAEYKAFLLGEE